MAKGEGGGLGGGGRFFCAVMNFRENPFAVANLTLTKIHNVFLLALCLLEKDTEKFQR